MFTDEDKVVISIVVVFLFYCARVHLDDCMKTALLIHKNAGPPGRPAGPAGIPEKTH